MPARRSFLRFTVPALTLAISAAVAQNVPKVTPKDKAQVVKPQVVVPIERVPIKKVNVAPGKPIDPKAIEAEADQPCANWGFEKGLQCWTQIPEMGNAFATQPTFDDNVLVPRVLAKMELANGGIGGDYWKGLPYPIGGVKRGLDPSTWKSQYWIGTFENHPNAQAPLGRAQGDEPQGELRSKPFRMTQRFVSFQIGGGNLPGVGVELQLPQYEYDQLQYKPPTTNKTADGWVGIAVAHGYNVEIMHRQTWDMALFLRAPRWEEMADKKLVARLVIFDYESGGWGHINVDDFRFTDADMPTFRSNDNGTVVRRDADQPVWGFADTHAHPTNQLGFGGNTIRGDTSGAMSQALSTQQCLSKHSGTIRSMGGRNHQQTAIAAVDEHIGDGYPSFLGWPRFNSKTHQQMHIDWIRRAYDGGERLIVALGVTNMYWATRELGPGVAPGVPVDDETTALAQIKMMQDIATANSDWMEVATTPVEARRIISSGKMAVVLGLEIDNFGNFKDASYTWLDGSQHGQPEYKVPPSNRLVALPADPDQARAAIRTKIARYLELGVRQVTPLHYVTGVFGGTAEFHWQFSLISHSFTGQQVLVKDGLANGVYFGMPWDGSGIQSWLGAAPMSTPESFYSCVDQNLTQVCEDSTGTGFHAGGVTSYEHDCCVQKLGSTRNALGLTPRGEILMQEIMRAGLMLDFEHASIESANKMFALAQRRRYPLMSSHTDPRELGLRPSTPGTRWTGDAAKDGAAFGTSKVGNVAHEGQLGNDGLEQIRLSGGTTGVLVFPYYRRAYTSPTNPVPNDLVGSTKTWAQAYMYTVDHLKGAGVGLATDRGFNDLIAPRFGTWAGYNLKFEDLPMHRDALRAQQKRVQSNGVRYDTDKFFFQTNRFEFAEVSGEEEDAWKAVAYWGAYHMSPFDGPAYERLPTDEYDCAIKGLQCKIPPSSDAAAHGGRIESLVRGLAANNENQLRECCGDSPWEEAAMFAAKNTPRLVYPENDRAVLDLLRTKLGKRLFLDHLNDIKRVYDWAKPVYDLSVQMKGDNEPLRKRIDGTRDWDFNIDGMAHVGMLPDFLQDLKNIGLKPQHLRPLFASAEDYILMWERVAAARNELTMTWQEGVNYFGNDLGGYDLPDADPQACAEMCTQRGAQCQGWSYVKPGIQGPSAKCWLKSSVTNPSQNACCVSGKHL